MNTTDKLHIEVWIDSIQTGQNLPSVHPVDPCTSDEKENVKLVKKRRMADPEQTPRPSKRIRDLHDAAQFHPPSPTQSASSDAASEVESHRSGRLSPVKQIQLLEDSEEYPIVFCNFDDNTDEAEPEDVSQMRRAVQRFADGVGILGYNDMDVVISALPKMDKIRFRYPWAKDTGQRCLLGSMPSIAQVQNIVDMARQYDRGSGSSEDEWNSEVHHPLLKLACNTSKHSNTLAISNVKTARIEPPSLARSALPGRVVDYVVTLKPDAAINKAWHSLRPLPGVSVKSWNHTTRARQYPIAIHVETKGPMKSWTDGKPQIAIWADAWLNRLALLRGNAEGSWPASPLLIAQGHDWHFLIVSKDGRKMKIWEQIAIGNTRSCFDLLKIVAVHHWAMDWAEAVWRPLFLSLID